MLSSQLITNLKYSTARTTKIKKTRCHNCQNSISEGAYRPLKEGISSTTWVLKVSSCPSYMDFQWPWKQHPLPSWKSRENRSTLTWSESRTANIFTGFLQLDPDK